MTDIEVNLPDREWLTNVLRSAINDAYRCGLGAAVQTVQEFRGRTVDRETFDEVLEVLRRISASADKS